MASTTATPPPSGHTKQYVFVDEYNRHKRLKVMRACDGCRKRKIRCDGALQNGPWPCGACVRLKLKCIPPTLDQDDEPQTPDSATDQQHFSFQTTTPFTAPTSAPAVQAGTGHSQSAFIADMREWTARLPPLATPPAGPTSAPLPPQDFERSPYASQPYQHPGPTRVPNGYGEEEYFGSSGSTNFHPGSHAPILYRSQTMASADSSEDPDETAAGVREMTEHMGEFRIETTSEAPYMAFQRKMLADTPAVEEVDVELPPSVAADSTVRIPAEMMPNDAEALNQFKYYFDHIHPYIPVLNRAQFYDQWENDRATLSPLLLEAMFACVARFLGPPILAQRWLALAARHEESFKDVPRLSTLQAMVLLMKARESLPKRGYYWRSWMAVKYMTTMCVDLKLDEHYLYHKDGNTCTLSRSDCMIRTRIWQTMFVMEILVGAPMGRSDFAVDPDTVQLSVPFAADEADRFEYQSSRRMAYLAQSVHHIKISNMLWQKTKRLKKEWALDPEFVRHNEDLPEWLRNLPADLQIHYPDDGSAPLIGGDHFKANLHAYFHLVIIMHHRPQMQAMLERRDPAFKAHLEICLDSATQMCRIQEALHRDFQFHGLQFMQRGINFTIYCVLTCMMLHLAAITSPDPFLNSRARLYFTRHMRVLEHCLPYSSPEMQAQINALREAFSADTSQAFELKATMGLRSPPMDNHPTPPSTNSGPTSAPVFHTPAWSTAHDGMSSRTLTPSSDYGGPYDPLTSHHPITSQPNNSYTTNSYDMPARTTYAVPTLSLITSTNNNYALEQVNSNESTTPVWDPSGIFNSWNTAFGNAPPPSTPQPTANPRSMPTSAPIMHSPTAANSMYGTQQTPLSAGHPIPEPAAVPAVTPVMWQDAFTSAFVSGHGQKRYREASVGDHNAAFMPQYSSTTKRRG